MTSGGERASRNGPRSSRLVLIFKGHYKPHFPADLGFYDLQLPETRRAQGPSKGNDTMIHGSDPLVHKERLEAALRRLQREQPEERIVFINAWNEWGEGDHLELDVRFGRAYLEVTKQAIMGMEAEYERLKQETLFANTYADPFRGKPNGLTPSEDFIST